MRPISRFGFDLRGHRKFKLHLQPQKSIYLGGNLASFWAASDAIDLENLNYTLKSVLG